VTNKWEKNYYCPVWVIVFKNFANKRRFLVFRTMGFSFIFFFCLLRWRFVWSAIFYLLWDTQWCSHLQFPLIKYEMSVLLIVTENAQFGGIRRLGWQIVFLRKERIVDRPCILEITQRNPRKKKHLIHFQDLSILNQQPANPSHPKKPVQ
jgi:hypothetical protein